MMKQLFRTLLLSVILFGSFAKARLGNATSTTLTTNTELVVMKSVPAALQINQSVTLFFQTRSELSNLEYVLLAQLNNENVINLTQTSENFWVGALSSFTTPGQQSVSVNIYVQDKKSAERIREAQSELLNRIDAITTLLLTETNPQKIANLQSEKTEKETYYNQLVADYNNLKVFYGSKNFDFLVSP